MSVSLSPPRLPASPGIIEVNAAPSIVPVATAQSPVRPLDLLIITSRTDFHESADLLGKEASQAGLAADTLFIEDLDGDSASEKLAQLRKAIGKYLEEGRLQPTTVTSISLHGGLIKLGDATTADTDEPGVVHCFGNAEMTLRLPSALVCLAVRQLDTGDDPAQAAYPGLLFIASCYAGGMPEQFLPDSGEVILLTGKKASLTSDGDDCMRQAVALMADRRQRGLSAPSGRDYWNHLRNVSGEHIRYANADEVALHKVLDWKPSEPMLRCRTGDMQPTAVRIVEAKLAHGSPAALKAALDLHGDACRAGLTPATCLEILGADRDRNEAELTGKIRVLEQAGLVSLSDPAQMALLLEHAIDAGNQRLLGYLLARPADGRPRPAALLEAARILVANAADSAARLEKYCEKHAELKSSVIDWLAEHVAANKTAAPGHRLNCEAIPQLAYWLSERQIGYLPESLGPVLHAHLTAPKEPQYRQIIMRTLIWGSPMDIWNCAMQMAKAEPANLEEVEQIKKSFSWLYAPAKQHKVAGRTASADTRASATPPASSDEPS